MNINNKILLKFILGLFICLTSFNAQAVKLAAEVGYHLGGDILVDPINNSSWTSINAGDLLTFGIGPQFDLSDAIHIRTLVGLKTSSSKIFNEEPINLSDNSVSFNRYPIDVLLFYQTVNWNFGAGLTYHLYPKLSGSGIPGMRYKNSLGYAVEVDFRFSEFFYIGGKATMIDYEEENSNTTVDGNSVGIVIGFAAGD